VTVILGGAALSVALTTRRMYELDDSRTMVNQNLRSGMNLLGIDVRQAGERLPGDAPAIELLDGDSGGTDTLIIRRNLLDYVLPLCRDISGGSSADSIFVAKKKITGKVPPGCAPVPDLNGDGWPDNLEAWRNYRIAHGGEVLAYIHNPVTAVGEFFVYDAEDNSTFHLHKANGDSWLYDYLMNQNPRVYIIEQKTFLVTGDVLQCVVNGDTDNPLNLVDHIEDFQGRAFFTDGSVRLAMGPSDPWSELASIEITLIGRDAMRTRDLERELVTHFFPRNILSH